VFTAIAAGALAVAAAAVWVSSPLLGAGPEVPTARVERRDFVRWVPAEGNLSAVRATPLSVPVELGQAGRIAWIIADGSRVAAGDPVVRFDPTEMEEQLTTAGDALATAEVKTAKTEVTIESELGNLERDARIAERELETADRFQKRDELIYSRSEIIESGLDRELAGERREHALAARETREELGGTDLELLDIERRKARLQMERAEQGLAALAVVAPHDGIAVLGTDWRGNSPRVGDTFWPGQPVAEIPDLAEMQAEVWVLEADAGGLAAGQQATVWVEAHPETPHRASVLRVDALAKPRLRGSPVQYFGALLRLEATDPATMKPGQRVRATIEAESRPGALVVPRQALFERDGERIVFRRAGSRRDGDGYEAVAVTVGPVTPALAVIEAGLEEGDEVALDDPEERPAAGADAAAAPGAGPLGGNAR
jgi:multidrug efflux pump subunit AcrA (membrane-fusion protein)